MLEEIPEIRLLTFLFLLLIVEALAVDRIEQVVEAFDDNKAAKDNEE